MKKSIWWIIGGVAVGLGGVAWYVCEQIHGCNDCIAYFQTVADPRHMGYGPSDWAHWPASTRRQKSCDKCLEWALDNGEAVRTQLLLPRAQDTSQTEAFRAKWQREYDEYWDHVALLASTLGYELELPAATSGLAGRGYLR